jgi:hypothetical protein
MIMARNKKEKSKPLRVCQVNDSKEVPNACGYPGFIGKELGSGTHGVVYSFKEPNLEESALKLVKGLTPEKINQFKGEVDVSTEMGDLGIGLKTKDAFLSSSEDGTDGYLFQEKAEQDLYDLFRTESSPVVLKEAVDQQLAQIKTMLVGPSSKKNSLWNSKSPVKAKGPSKWICTDIKPENFLVKKRKPLDIRMADFGTQFCFPRNKMLNDVAALTDGSLNKEELNALVYAGLAIQTLALTNVYINDRLLSWGSLGEALDELEELAIKYPKVNTAFKNLFSYGLNLKFYYKGIYGEDPPEDLLHYIDKIRSTWLDPPKKR